MPTSTVWEEQAYYNATSTSSWTGVAYTLFTAALTYASAGAYGLAMGIEGGVVAETVAAQAAMAYAGGSLAINGGPITQTQDGWMASVGWTPQGVGNGVIHPAIKVCLKRHI